MKTVMCNGTTKQTTRVRGWYDYYDCRCKAKFKVTYPNGSVEYLCGRHKNQAVSNFKNIKGLMIEPIKTKE